MTDVDAMDRPGRDRGWKPEGKHFSDYWRVLRDRWIVAVLGFALGAGWITWNSLRADPVYESFGTIQIEDPASTDALLAELGAADGRPNVEAELLVMRSRFVARAAAERAGLHAVVEQRNAYRPWEGLLRTLGFEGPPCRLSVEAAVPPPGSWARGYEVVCHGRSVDIRHLGGEQSLAKAEFGPEGRLSVTLDQEVVTLSIVEGDPDGKTFDLWIRSLDDAAAWIQSGVVSLQVGTRTGFASVGFRGTNPHLVQRAAAAVHSAYLDHKLERKKSQLIRRGDWLAGQRARVEKDLRAAEEELDRYIKAEGAVLLSERAQAGFEEQGRLLAQRLEQEQALQQAEAAISDLRAAHTAERILLLLGQEQVDARTAALAASVAELEVDRAVLTRAGRTPADPEVQRLQASIDETRRLLEEGANARRDQAISELTREAEMVKARIQRIDQENQRQEERIRALPNEEREIAQRTRAVEANARAFEQLTRWENETRIATASAVAAATPVDVPTLPFVRTRPVLWRQAVVALLVGSLLAVLAAFTVNYLDRRIRSPQQLEREVSLQLYAAIPDFRTVPRRERRRIGHQHGGRLPTLTAPTSVVAEAYRTLRANLRFASIDRPVRTLAITSSVAQEGKTVTTANLAVVLAQGRSRVLVIDADMRRPSAHTVFGSPLTPGLADVLGGDLPWREAIRPVAELETLHLLPAGRPPENPGALLDSGVFTRLLSEVREAYDYVLFDVPPVLAVADAAAFFRQLDAIVLLARYRRGTPELVDGARAQIERMGGRVVGAVFNAFDARKAARRGYGQYGYYGYYGYSSKEEAPRAERQREARPS